MLMHEKTCVIPIIFGLSVHNGCVLRTFRIDWRFDTDKIKSEKRSDLEWMPVDQILQITKHYYVSFCLGLRR